MTSWKILLLIVISASISSCGFVHNRQIFPATSWNVNERTEFSPYSQYATAGKRDERFMRVPLDPEKKSHGDFDLYYFVHKPNSGNTEVKTIVFLSGGPGEIFEPGDSFFGTTFLRDPKYNTNYNIVYFHLRGAGLSQLPPSNDYDKYLKTKHAVEDLDMIRKEVLGARPWDGIVGYSYGTILGQQYAAKYPEKVRKLVLIAPMSMHKFSGSSSMKAYDEFSIAVGRIRREILDGIFAEHQAFKDNLTGSEKETIKLELANVFSKIELNFGSEQFIVDHYCKLQSRGLLSKYGLGFSRTFFEKLRQLRTIGWKPSSPGNPTLDQVEAVQVISVSLIPGLEQRLGASRPDDACSPDSNDGRRVDIQYRALSGTRAHDGAQQRFLKEWVAEGKSNVRWALKKSAGLAHIQDRVNDSIEKLGIANDEPIRPWDPAEYQHNVPTLLVEGSADPVTADEQAMHYLNHGLFGPRTLIHFRGVGHTFEITNPQFAVDPPFVVGSVRLDPGRVGNGKVVTIKETITTTQPRTGTAALVGGGVPPITFDQTKDSPMFFPDSDVVFISAANRTTVDQNIKNLQVDYDHGLFTVRVTIDTPKIPPGWSWIVATVTNVTPKFRIEKPSNLEQGLEIESFSMDRWHELTVKIKNTTADLIEAKPKDWRFVPTNQTVSRVRAPCQSEQGDSRQCVIYSFLETEHEDFRSSKNELLKQMESSGVILPPRHCRGSIC